MKPYQLYLFDMDGTLVNSEPLKGQAIAMACVEMGGDVDFHVYKQVMGESWSVVSAHFFKHAGISPDIEQFNRRFRAHYEHLLSKNLHLTEGARAFLNWLKCCAKPCAVVSSAAPWMVERILKQLALDDQFEMVITQADVQHHKPHPEAFLLALSKFNVAPQQTLVFEDSYAGVRAAVASGCDVIAIKHAFNGGNDLSQALCCIDSYHQLLPAESLVEHDD